MSDAVAGALQKIGSRPADTILVPESVEELTAILRDSPVMTLVPTTGRTKLGLGNDVVGPFGLLDLSHMLPGTIEHEPADMTVIVDATVTVRAVQDRLRTHGQRLPLDPALPDDATIGGVLATGRAGPLQTRFGLPRDHALGMTVVRADGAVVKAGGRVVKNVTGYDLVRTWCGSLGTLGVIVSAALRVVPLAETEDLAWKCRSVDEACSFAREILRADLRPEFVEAMPSSGNSWTLMARLPVPALGAARRLLGAAGQAGGGIYEACRDIGFRPQDALAVRIVTLPATLPGVVEALMRLTPSTVAARPIIGSVSAAWTEDAMPDRETAARFIDELRGKLGGHGGSVTAHAMPDAFRGAIDAWGAAGGSVVLMHRLKAAYDPDSRFNRGRFVDGI